MIRRAAILVLVCGLLAFFLRREEQHGTFDEWHAHALRALGAERAPAVPVILVDVEPRDLPFESWPPAPLDYALLFEKLVHRQPAAVAVEPILSWPTLPGVNTATLAERVTLLPRGVLACTIVTTPAAAGGGELRLPVVGKIEGDPSRVPSFGDLGVAPPPEITGTKAMGFVRFDLQPMAAAQNHELRVPMLARREGKFVPSLALQTLVASQGITADQVTGRLGESLRVGTKLEIPVDDSGAVRLHTRVPAAVPRLTAGSLLLDVDRDAGLLDKESGVVDTLKRLQGSVLVIGETGEGTPQHALGRGRTWSEAETVAQTLHAALSGRHVREVSPPWQWALAGAAVLGGLGLLRCPRRWVLGFGLAGAAVLVLQTVSLFMLGQWWLPPFLPLALWSTAVTVALLLPPPPAAASAPTGPPVELAEPTSAPEPAAAAVPDVADEPPLDGSLIEEPAPELEEPPISAPEPDASRGEIPAPTAVGETSESDEPPALAETKPAKKRAAKKAARKSPKKK